MTFTLKIFFMGLIAFVPSQDEKELTVLLVETRPGHVASDGSLIAPHHPMLLARAERCWGHCGIDERIDPGLLFPKDSATDARKYLAAALGNGAAWTLDGSDLSIVDAGPRRSGESLTMDLDDVAHLGRIVPSAGVVDSDTLARLPQRKLITGRLRLRSGNVWTWRLVHVADKVRSFDFKSLRPEGAKAGYSQPIADWVAAEIELSGDEVEIVETRFASEEIRTIRLAPQDGLVELAVMNIPDPPSAGSEEAVHEHHEVDRHFELYYRLAETPPPPWQFPVPHVGPAVETPETGSQKARSSSGLLAGLKLDGPKGYYERIMCPVGQLSEGGAP